jgi:AcrR family transcriptional regulator
VVVAVPSRVSGTRPVRPGVDRAGGRSGVADIQRARMIAAMAALARERGVAGVSVAHVVARSGVSRRTFYELFEDRNDCFRAAFEQGVARAAERVVPAYRAARGWRVGMRAGLEALLGFLEEQPDLGVLCTAVALGASPVVLDRRGEVVAALVDAVDKGRQDARGSARPTRLTAEGVVGAVLAVLHARLSDGAPVAGLEASLMGMIVLPYLGLAVAARESAAPPVRVARPARGRPSAPAEGDPLRDLHMRLTYRTVQVLLAIGELGAGGSGPSNRRVADAAGIADPGQISKLLARLEHLALIENNGAGPARGEPNVWSLTPKGREIERAIRR